MRVRVTTIRGGRGNGLFVPAPAPAPAACWLLRATNRRNKTCLHEAVRHGHAQVVESLLMADTILYEHTLLAQASSSTAVLDDVMTTAGPPLVRMVDSDGISLPYLATTLRRLDIVRMLAPVPGSREKLRYYTTASYAGPRGETALHAAVLLSKELSEQLCSWDKDLTGVQDIDSKFRRAHHFTFWRHGEAQRLPRYYYQIVENKKTQMVLMVILSSR